MSSVNGTSAPGDVSAPKSEWEKYWELVTKNPDDFTSWEFLIRLAEGAGGGLTPDSPESDIVNLEHVYNSFLTKFPLCFGYWKKYADWENILKGKDASVAVFERGVAAIHNSIELWVHYCAFRVEHYSNDEETIRQLFEKATISVGYDFFSHPIWDKYIEWEESRGYKLNVVKILDKLVTIPLHQYARFFEKYLTFVSSLQPSELVPADQLVELEEKVKAPNGDQPIPKTDDELVAALRKAIYDIKSAVYMKTQEEVLKRWTFEAEIKRSYFHVKPLDDAQLANWKKYLDFEEAEGNEARVYVLYERCLVPCALYEEFWLRYAYYMLSKDNSDGAQSAFYRASYTFIPASRPQVRLAYAQFQEAQGHIKEARDLYKLIQEAIPGHVESILRIAQFERRQVSLEAAVEVFNKASEGATLSDRAKAYIAAHHAKMIYGATGGVDVVREIYKSAIAKYSEARFLWMSYVIFEVSQPGAGVLVQVKEAYDAIKSSNLSIEDKRDLAMRCLDVFHERCLDVSQVNIMEAEFQKYSLPTAAGSSGARKRALEDAASTQPARTQPYSTPTGNHAAAPVTAIASPAAVPATGGASYAGYAQGYGYGAPTAAY